MGWGIRWTDPYPYTHVPIPTTHGGYHIPMHLPIGDVIVGDGSAVELEDEGDTVVVTAAVSVLGFLLRTQAGALLSIPPPGQ